METRIVEIAERIKGLREMMDITPEEMAEAAGVELEEYLKHENPTMSKVLYTQQLGRGMRLSPGKESLMVFDFVDNASQYNMPYSMHRLFRLKEYKPGALVLGAK